MENDPMQPFMMTSTMDPTPQGFNPVISQQLQFVQQLQQQHEQQVLLYAQGFLDKVFPLAHGSHRDVKSYVVYYHHLLAFFADGSNSGLAQPCQFVAFSGSKEQPHALLLLQQGRHVELRLSRQGTIDDIQWQPEAGAGSDWFSMVKAKPSHSQPSDKRCGYTAKDGGVYRVTTSA
jgi:malate synthase